MSKEYAQRLLNAQSEAQVTELLEKPLFEDQNWKPLGGPEHENNYGTIANQAADALQAFSELITNAVDAILTKNYRQYEREVGYCTAVEAVGEFVDTEKEEIKITADGERRKPNMIVEDTGEGKHPDEMEDTFLGLSEPGRAKQKYPFLQGQYGMGGTAPLPFCGEKGYKFIATASHTKPGRWGWTIIHKNRDKNRYEYLARTDGIPIFDGKLRGKKYGTVIKLYNYRLSRRSHITARFREHLDRVYPRIPIPTTIVEARDFKSEFPQVTTTGIIDEIEKHPEIIKDVQTWNHDFGELGELGIPLGVTEVRRYLFKGNDELDDEGIPVSRKRQRRSTQKRAVIYTINGQMHGGHGQSFIKNRCKRPRVDKDTLIFVSLDGLDLSDMVDLVQPSRDRLKHCEEAKDLRDQLVNIVENDVILKEEMIRRRKKRVSREVERKKSDILADYLQRDPKLIQYLMTGKRVSIPESGTEPIRKISYPFYPDILKSIFKFRSYGDYDVWRKDKMYVKRVPANFEQFMVRFKLNAPDDFFSRDRDIGKITLNPSINIKSSTQKNGVLTLVLKNILHLNQGDKIPVTVEIEPGMKGTLTETFELEIVEPVKRQGGGGGGQEPTSLRKNLPPIERVEREGWTDYDPPFDEEIPTQVEDEGDQLVITVNMDHYAHRKFINTHNLTEMGKEVVAEVFVAGMALHTLAVYREFEAIVDGENGISPGQLTTTALKGVARSLLVQAIPEDRLGELTV